MPGSYLTNGNNDRSSEEVLQGAPFQALRRFTREREQTRLPVEHCELCSQEIPPEHRHVLDISKRVVLCACQACSLLFSNETAAGGKYRVIPRRHLALLDFHMTDEQWDDLMIPVNIIYIFRSTAANGVMAFYPGPAGATESLLSLAGWEALVSSNPILNDLAPDVEALLINRVKNSRMYYIVPIDACYQLVGLIRLSWKGLSGGEEVWKAIGEFFANIQAKSEPVRGEPDARPEL